MSAWSEQSAEIRKIPTGIRGFDHVAMGGLTARRATVIAGQAGSAKTLFAAQFLAQGVGFGQPGVFVTLEEPAADLRVNLRTLGWDIEAWEAAGDWRFVDASPLIRPQTGEYPAYSVETLAAQIGHAVDATAADRIVLDSLTAVLALQPDAVIARRMLRELVASLRAMGLTIVMTIETPGDPGGHALGLRGRRVRRRQRRAATQRSRGLVPAPHGRDSEDARCDASQG